MANFSVSDILLMSIPVLVSVGFLSAVFITFGRSVFRWFHDNSQPLLTGYAKVLSKREDLRRSMRDSIEDYVLQFKAFYVTFELENGKQLEFLIPPGQIGKIDEGDVGKLSYQGSRFKGFVG